MKNWNGLCRRCTNGHIIETKIKGVRRVSYKICTLCGKESYWIKNSSTCKKCRLKNMPKGSNHYKWKKDRTTLVKRQERNDMAYREWRKRVWERDNYKCQLSNDMCNGKIEAHHIITWSEDESKRYDVNNGITLCNRHHPKKKVHVNALKEIFISIINNKL